MSTTAWPVEEVLRFRGTLLQYAVFGVCSVQSVLEEVHRVHGANEASEAQLLAYEKLRTELGQIAADADDHGDFLETPPIIKALVLEAAAATEAGIELDYMLTLAARGKLPGGASSNGG